MEDGGAATMRSGEVEATSLEQLAHLADDLLHQARAVRVHYEEAARRLEGHGHAEGSPAPMRVSPRDEPALQTVDPLEEARLVATNMASYGQDRQEAERFLSDTFGVDDAATIVDDAYGPEIAPQRRRLFARGR